MRFMSGLMVLVCATVTAHAGSMSEESAQGRQVLEKYRLAVVTVQLTVKSQMAFMGMDGEESETKSEITGTVISPDGLTVVALSATDPMGMLSNMFGEMTEEMQMSSRVTDTRILREDGTEIPARIVLRDKDLDLAFVRPIEKPAEAMACVDLQSGGSVQLMDPVVALSRMGKVVNRAYAGDFLLIRAIVTRPRTYYVPSLGSVALVGSPIFTLDGQVLGLTVLRTIKGSSNDPMSSMMSMFGGGMQENMTAIVLPAKDVLEVSAQAPGFGEAVPEEETPAEDADAQDAPADAGAEEPAEKPAEEPAAP